jgi:arylsulfatase A-like enzyme
MSKLFFILILLPLFAIAQQKPNIILIFADDLGYKDVGFTGSKIFETPNIDMLAKKGMVFANAYAGAGNCVPSRACLLSGLYSPRTGMYAVASTTRGPRKEMKVVPVKHTKELAPSFVTMAEALQQEGYTTGLFGKWHLGNKAEVMPPKQGFDVYFDSRKENYNNHKDKLKDPKGIFSLTDAALSFMKENKTTPFFTYLAHHAIHSNLEAKPETIEYFKKKGLDDAQATYAASIYNLDESIALIMAFLQNEGLDKNTLVIFTSDNGAIQQSSQEPLRGSKGCYYEGGIREPFIAYWPGKIKEGTTNHTPIINLDLYPTFLAIAGNKNIKLDGENLMPLFTAKETDTKRQTIFWHFPGYLNTPVNRGRDSIFRSRPVTAMRKGDWKILLFYEEWILDGGRDSIDTNHAVELYNLKEDEGERIDLAFINKKKRDELLNDLLAWLQMTNAKLPVAIDATHQLEESVSSNDN